MKYYLVGLFDKDSYKFIESIQKDLSKKYNIYDNLPMLHITLEVIDNANIEILDAVLIEIFKKYKKFHIEVNGAICFKPPYKSVNLKINNTGTIKRLVKNINETLKADGFNVRENVENWDLHISLANTNFSNREWTIEEYSSACNITKEKNYKRTITIEEIQLWKPVNNKDEMVIKRYPL